MLVEPLRRARLCIFLLRLPPRSLVYLRLHSDAQNHDYPRTRTSFQVTVAGAYSLTLQNWNIDNPRTSLLCYPLHKQGVQSFLPIYILLYAYRRVQSSSCSIIPCPARLPPRVYEDDV
ncbi:hypothetical protein ARMGADRAFT_352524 [Armillaria gallica]|uniref:Uncharacterized protein n=1 Tax=Armillaria gallica TaxID=47427 RepID=A0A2H3D054_ARMGA|nr:hypothetical protein ARMGADRAFT_352524 [Armillaria gallica]